MPERGGHEPVRVQHCVAALTASHPTGSPLQHVERRGNGGVGRVANLIRHLRITERVQQRHRLRRAERRVEPRDNRHRPRRRQLVGAVRVKMLEDATELVGVDFAVEAELLRAASDPLAGRLLRARVVLLGATRDRVDVVLLLTRPQLAETQHAATVTASSGADKAARTGRCKCVSVLGQGGWEDVSALHDVRGFSRRWR